MRKIYKVKNLCCANCAAKMERAIGKIEGVESASLHFMAQKLMIDCDEDRLSDILEKTRAVIAKIEPDCILIG